MNRLIRIATVLMIAVSASACARIPQPISVALSATIPAKTVIVAAKTFGGLEVGAAHYLGLPICNVANRPICREPSATPIIKGAVLSGRIARNELKVQVRLACAKEFAAGLECDKGIPVASYNTLVAASNTIGDATAAWRAATNQQ